MLRVIPWVAYEFPQPSPVLEQPASRFPIWHNRPRVRGRYFMLPLREASRRVNHIHPSNGLAALARVCSFGRYSLARAQEDLASPSPRGPRWFRSVRLANRHGVSFTRLVYSGGCPGDSHRCLGDLLFFRWPASLEQL